MENVLDKTKVNLTNEENKNAIKLLNDIHGILSYLNSNLTGDNLQTGEVTTSLGLCESYLAELSSALGYNGTLKKEYEERHREIREKNTEIQRLTALLGTGVNASAVCGALRRYEDIFRAWYEALSFNYASTDFGPWGLSVVLHEELHNGDGRISSFALSKRTSVSELIGAGYVIEEDKYSAHLLDRDQNKEKITALITTSFPNSRIQSYQGKRLDSHDFGLEIKVFIPYSDIEDFAAHNTCIEKK